MTLSSPFLQKRFILRNSAVWATLYLFSMLAQYLSRKGNQEVYVETTLVLLSAMVIFYGNFYLCHTLFIRSKILYALSLLGFAILYMVLLYQLLIRSTFGGSPLKQNQAIAALIYLTLYFAIMILLSGFYWSTLFAAQKIKENARMQLDLQRMANEKMFAEKKFLQSQVNPHFLYNTLNFLYAKSLKGPAELSDGIMTLSAIMKYALKKNENTTGFVPLEEEVTHLNNIIHIHQLRFNGRLQISFSIAGDLHQVELLPFVLITLVENALKHGEWNDPDSPIRINLLCNQNDQKVHFSVLNRKREGPKENCTGIGLENAVSRLKWSYSDNYSLQITEDADLFKAELTIPLYKNVN